MDLRKEVTEELNKRPGFRHVSDVRSSEVSALIKILQKVIDDLDNNPSEE